MAAIAPYLFALQGPRGDNLLIPRTSIPLDGYSISLLPAPTIFGTATILQPEPSPFPVLAALMTRTSFDDWYYRIHIVPQEVNLGNMSGDRTVPITVWNAFFSPVTIEEFSYTQVEGVTVEEPQGTPITLQALRTTQYELLVSASGPALVSATLTWTIDGVEYVVPVSGRRSVTFSARPNWADGPMMETLTWATTVTRSWGGQEQRMGISRAVRRSFSYRALVLNSVDRQRMDSMLFGWQGRSYSLPLWNEATRIDAPVAAGDLVVPVDTSQLTLAVGGSVLLYLNHATFESAEVEFIDANSITVKSPLTNSWPLGTKLIPAAAAFPGEVTSTTRPVPEYASIPMTFVLDPAARMNRVQVTAPDTLYRGVEAYFVETDWASDMEVVLTANRRESDSGLGPIRMMPKGEFPATSRSFRWICWNRNDANWLRNFFHRRRGRHLPVWMPSGAEDFTLVQPISASDTIIRVADNEYASFIAQQKIRRDIVLLMRDGRRLCRRIIDSATEDGYGSLALNDGFGEEISPADVKRVSYLGFYRLAQDAVTFNWHTDQVAVVETDFILTEPDE